MKAAVIYEYGGPEVFRYEEIPQPEISAHEVLVEVHAASVNPVAISLEKLFLSVVPTFEGALYICPDISWQANMASA